MFVHTSAQGSPTVAPGNSNSNQAGTRPFCNINLCFALDASTSITSEEFDGQIFTVIRTVRRLAQLFRVGRLGLAAVQFSAGTQTISSFSTQRRDFISAVRSAVQASAPESFPTGGINFCFNELFDRNSREKRIVVLGNGQSTLGSDPGERADDFRAEEGKVFAVGVGTSQNTDVLLQIAGGKTENLFSISNGSEAEENEIATMLARALCE